MGAEPWDYFVPYESNIQAALEKLRQREFRAGRYEGSDQGFATADEAYATMVEEEGCGTSSILDITRVADAPDFCAVAPLPGEALAKMFGTDRPTRQQIEQKLNGVYEDIDRGQGVYIVAYKDGKPSEIFFGGYSFD